MSWIETGNPYPRKNPQKYTQFQWPKGNTCRLPRPGPLSQRYFEEVIESRATAREFGSITLSQISYFLWLSHRIKQWGNDSLGFHLTIRPTPSAGAIHPLHIIINLDRERDWARYDPAGHALIELPESSGILHGLLQEAEAVLPTQQGAIIQLVAEPGMAFAKYEEASSLIWRDAGGLISHMALVAQYLSLNFCPLGITGEPWIKCLDNQGKLAGVGLALIGAGL